MYGRPCAVFCALALLLAPAPAQAGWFGDVHDYWISGEMGLDMLNTIGLDEDAVVYAIDHPGDVAKAMKAEAASGRAGERLLGYVGTNAEAVAKVVEDPGAAAENAYDEVASGRTGEKVLNSVGLTADEVAFMIDNPEALNNALYDEWSTGQSGERLILYGEGLYDGGKEVIGEVKGLIEDGGAYVYIVSVYDDYEGAAGAYEPQSKLVMMYKQTDDPGATTALLLNNLKNLPGQFASDMASDPKAAGRTVGAFAVPIAVPKGIGALSRTVPKLPGMAWTGTRLTIPGRGAACATASTVVADLEMIRRAATRSPGRATAVVSTEARTLVSSEGTLTLRVATQPKGLKISGQLLDEYHAFKPGPLTESTATAQEIVNSMGGTFSGGKYAAVRLTKPTVVYRLHNNATPTTVWNPIKRLFESKRGASETGAYWTLERPAGMGVGRLDGGVLPEWGNSMTHLTAVELQPGTVIYVGEVGAQRGLFVGGGSQLVVKGGIDAALKATTKAAKIVERVRVP